MRRDIGSLVLALAAAFVLTAGECAAVPPEGDAPDGQAPAEDVQTDAEAAGADDGY